MNKWIDIAPDLTKKGQKKLKTGQVLMFVKDGEENNLRIMRKSKGKVWAKFVHMYLPDEVGVKDVVRD